MLAFLTSQPPLSKSIMGDNLKKKTRLVSTDTVTEENRMDKHLEEDSSLRHKK